MISKSKIENQPFVFQTFLHALEQNKVAHAYLVKGADGAPLLATALLLAKTLLCEHSQPFACETCFACLRFEDKNSADFFLLDAEKNTVKVADVLELQHFFQHTAMEKTGRKVYVVHLLENTNKETVNALLKCMEEPQQNIYCILTTANESKLLPTILSRVQHLKLLPERREQVLLAMEEAGISDEEAEILSTFAYTFDAAMVLKEDETYQLCKEAFFDTLEGLSISKEECLYRLQKDWLAKLKTKEQARFFLDLWSLLFKDMLHLIYQLPLVLTRYATLTQKASKKIKEANANYRTCMITRGQIDLNVNCALLLEHVFISIQ